MYDLMYDSTGYNTINISGIVDIQNYLMKQHDMKQHLILYIIFICFLNAYTLVCFSRSLPSNYKEPIN